MPGVSGRTRRFRIRRVSASPAPVESPMVRYAPPHRPPVPRSTTDVADRLLEILNGGALALALSVGHRTGLLDVLGALPPSTSTEVAGRAGLDERYVREWLAVMATGGLVAYDPVDRTYRLPPSHAAVLTRRGAPHNLAVQSQFIPLLARVQEGLEACFREGGGLDYDAYPGFHDIMAETSSQTVVSALYDGILPLVPGLRARLERGCRVLDVGCGKGRALVSLASAFPNSRFRGYDLSREAVDAARRTVDELRLRNVRFAIRDAATLDEPSAYELVTAFDCIHDQADPARVLRGIRRALRPDGVFLMQDIAAGSRLEENLDHPLGPFLYTLSFAHCMSVSLARGGAGLGACWGRQRALAMLDEAGFRSVSWHELPHDVLNYFYVARARGGPDVDDSLSRPRAAAGR